jgi:hypothetical protein
VSCAPKGSVSNTATQQAIMILIATSLMCVFAFGAQCV